MMRRTRVSIAGAALAGLLGMGNAGHAAETGGHTVSVLFAGDIVLDGKPGKAIEQGHDPFAAFAGILANADVRIGNLECVVASGGEQADKTYTFRAHPRSLDVLKRHFDAVGIANNHSGDYGREAFGEMLGLLRQKDLPYFGGGRNLREAHAPWIMVRKGIRIAFLAYDEFLPRSFEAGSDAAGVAWSEDEQVIDDIKKARSVYRADVVIPFMHWGWENEMTANPRQRRLARIMIDAGADAVIGGHPHVIQDVDIYKGKPIIYSLGNFMIDELDNEAQTRVSVLKLSVDSTGILSWQTRLGKIDADGIPHPVSGVGSPCWKRDQLTPGMCTSEN
ncbi:CapA family protein [Undibacterium sp.]|jgi:poly-gamma-glutamate capsule biosynthesis protein CapA/YwtB (metallophosphatase superfamily)|uniref:CapA family protein n=1 Tax=Undibacterium sp. TaxID=1914977 RepID=UPI002B998691|nr:CapA family protein [Undibacterium sp.]HTD03146.1 CapA family protein [Undibacterium sp.]